MLLDISRLSVKNRKYEILNFYENICVIDKRSSKSTIMQKNAEDLRI